MKTTSETFVQQAKRQVDEGERKGFDFSRDSFFTKILRGRLKGLLHVDQHAAAILIERATALGLKMDA